ncbi:restriction endonuclease [Amycolatopsis sp. cg13]|uniref:restriction endonuclease n=1 Tax=Amycolatopsis sp. cg13 TaxID=3238807 RepID=UPI003524F0A5
MSDTEDDVYQLLDAGKPWGCPRCGRNTTQYPALSHVRDERTGDSAPICSDCGDDEDFQMWIDGTSPTAAQYWPVRRQLGSMMSAKSGGIWFGPRDREADATGNVRVGVYWDGKLEEWLTTLLRLDPDGERSQKGLHTWSFPTRGLLDEYLASITARSEREVRRLLRHLLFEGATFGFDDDLHLSLIKQGEAFEELVEQHEYFRRLTLTMRAGMHAHPGVRWVIDLLPDSPARAAMIIESYARAHHGRLPGGRSEGLADAVAVINTYYIDNSSIPWREALMSITPRQFECLVARLYAAIGFDVTLTPPSRDGGRDVVALKSNPGGKQKLLIECKQYGRKVDIKAARALLGVVSNEHATGGVLVTTSGGTKGVHSLASANARFDFVDGPRLVVLLNEHLGPQWPQRLDWLARPL